MRSIKNVLIVLLMFLISAVNYSSAETAPAAMTDMTAQAAPAAVKKQVAQPATAPQVAEVKSGICDCLKGAIDAIQKAYVSLEEDEWPAAIKSTKDAITTINTVSKNCTCPETIAYGKLGEAYLKYAEGGNHLDGAEEPNCPVALKLYADAIKMLDESIQKVSDEKIKSNAKNIKEYAVEEEQFVKDECQKT